MKKNPLSSALATTRATFRDPMVAISAVGIIGLLFVFVVWPLLEVIRQSLVASDGTISFTAYWKILSTRQNLQAFINTMQLAVIVGILAAIWCAAANLYTDYKHEEVRRLYADRKH